MITLDNVGVTYGGEVEALRPVSTRFIAGEFVVLLGPSGAGKSTLLRSINGLVPVTRGKIIAEGIGDIADKAALRKHRRNTAMIFQQHQLIGRLSTLRNVLTGRLAYHNPGRTLLPLGIEDRRIAVESLDRVGLAELALRRADQLSGGQQQRVGIARAITQKPNFVLADEPVASLDPATSRKVLGLIHSICKSDGIGAIVSLHQVDLAEEFADRVLGISDGQIVFDGPAKDLSKNVLADIYDTPTTHEVARAMDEQERDPELTPEPVK